MVTRPEAFARERSPAVNRLRGLLVVALAVTALLACTPGAWAHAQLLGTSPQSGSTVPSQPKEVIFKFGEDIGGTLGAVRVYNAQGNEVDDLDVVHPNRDQRWMGVGLKPGLPDGTYTATYRVISADTHIVSGGLVFSIGRPGAAPRFTVAGLISRSKSGRVTAIAFGAVRGLNYLTLALMVGGLVFLLLAWLPGLSRLDGGAEARLSAARALSSRLRTLLAFTIVVGILVSVLGVLLQGASAAGLSLWGSLKRPVIQATLESRFGEVWGLRALDWILIGMLSPMLRRAVGEGSKLARAVLVPLVLSCAYLAITPALAGHASVESPVVVFFPSDVLHVLAGSIWVGGVCCLLILLPAATRRLGGAERSRLLLAVLTCFSPIALAAVVAIALTGTIQAYIDVRSIHGLLHSTYGALIIAKSLLLLALIMLGWVNRTRVIPALEHIVGDDRPPGGIGALARRSLRSELALMLAVFGVTAALISYVPPIDAASGPFAINALIGPAELEMTVEPATVGLNTIHLYLIDAKTGAQFTTTKELTVTARLPSKRIGPLSLKANLAGPGHYALDSAVLSPGGTWELEITDRVSEFDEYTRSIRVPIR